MLLGLLTSIEPYTAESEDKKMKDCCGECKFNKRDFNNQIKNSITFCCGNEDSEMYGVPTFYDDYCENFTEKDR